VRQPSKKVIARLFYNWFRKKKFTTSVETFTAGYEQCWKEFEEFVRIEEEGLEKTSLGQGVGERFFDREGKEIEGPGGV